MMISKSIACYVELGFYLHNQNSMLDLFFYIAFASLSSLISSLLNPKSTNTASVS